MSGKHNRVRRRVAVVLATGVVAAAALVPDSPAADASTGTTGRPASAASTAAAPTNLCASSTSTTPAPPDPAPTSTTGQVTPSFPTGTTTVMATPKSVPNTTPVSGVVAWDTQGWPGNGETYPGAVQHNHVTGPVQYAVWPPIGGPHNANWLNAGVYTVPVPNERAVHNLEHGAVWITYRPVVTPAQVAQLVAFVDQQTMISEGHRGPGKTLQANRYIDLTPWPNNNLPSAIVASSWGYQLRLTDPTDPRLQQFVDTFRCSTTYTPEKGEPVDGISTKIGGNPARDGSLEPNPA